MSFPFRQLHPHQESSCPGLTTVTRPDCGLSTRMAHTLSGQMVFQKEKIYFLQKGEKCTHLQVLGEVGRRDSDLGLCRH